MNNRTHLNRRRTAMNLDYLHPKEGAMLQRQLHQMEQQAHTLRRVLHPDDNVPAWTQYKIATAQDRLSAAHGYLTHKIHRMMDWGGITDADFAYAFSGMHEDGEDGDDLGASYSKGRARRKSRRFKRQKKGVTSRKIAIVARIAVKSAKLAGKKVSLTKTVSAAKKAGKTKKSVRAAVIAGLIAGGLSSSDARKYASLGLAIARKGQSKKAVEKSLKRQAARRKKYLAKKKSSAKKKSEKDAADKEMEALEDEESGVSDENDVAETEDFSEEDAEDAEMAEEDFEDEEFEDEDLSGILGDTFDKAKPYLPWALLALGGVAILTASRQKTKSRSGKTSRRNRK